MRLTNWVITGWVVGVRATNWGQSLRTRVSSWPVGLSLACLRFGCRGKAKKGTGESLELRTCEFLALHSVSMQTSSLTIGLCARCHGSVGSFWAYSPAFWSRYALVPRRSRAKELLLVRTSYDTASSSFLDFAPCSSSLCQMPPLRWGSWLWKLFFFFFFPLSQPFLSVCLSILMMTSCIPS